MYKSRRELQFVREELLGEIVIITFVDRDGELLETHLNTRTRAFINHVTPKQIRFIYSGKKLNPQYDQSEDGEDEFPPEAFSTEIREDSLGISEVWNEVNLENNPQQERFKKIAIMEETT